MNPYKSLSEEKIIEKLEMFRMHASEGKIRETDDVVADIRTKYGL